MNRLSTYLVRLFTRDTAALLGVMLGLLFLVQCLRIFDVVVVQGQNLWTLVGQALLGMPPLVIVIAYVCMGIGLVRAFAGLQGSQELHVIHANGQLGALVRSLGIFAVAGAVIVLLISNFIEPWSNRQLNDWAASIAADIVGRTLTPHRISQVVPGVTVVIGARQGTGNITDFFADDRRDPLMRRTYSAKTAKVGSDKNGYVLQLNNGTLQYLSDDKDFSEISFKGYNIALSKLTGQLGSADSLGEATSWELVSDATATGHWTPDVVQRLVERMTEGLRAIAMTVFMGGLLLLPHARRGRGRLPLELVPLMVAYADKTINGSIAGPPYLTVMAGPVVILLAGSVILAFRLQLFFHLPRARTI
ncbi:MAG: LptF/LptG family permease [Devosia sp.]|nr:LptF/LptG family permease [Devosia sp.]